MNTKTGTGATLADFLDDCRTLTLEEFQRKNGRAFLVHHGSIDKLRKPLDEASTLRVEPPESSGSASFVPEQDFLVFKIETPTSAGSSSDIIWIGRSETNEVIISDISVSEVHAFIRFDDEGFFIQDTGSRNGTQVNEVVVPPQGIGDSIALPAGARVRFGAVKMTFLLAQQFRTLVLGLLD